MFRDDFSIISENFTNISSIGKKFSLRVISPPPLTVNVSFFQDPMRVKRDHTQFVRNALRVWKPMQIHQGRCNVIKALQAKGQTSSRIQTQTVAAGQEPRQTHKNTNTIIQPTMNQIKACTKKSFDSTDKASTNRRINRIWK